MESRALKRIDILRHELKALRYILDNYHAGQIEAAALPPREDFQSQQARTLYSVIAGASSRAEAERKIADLELDDVDIASFLRLTGEHYYAYPALVSERAKGIRDGTLRIEAA
ncbi:MAG: hypothetical protein ABSG46_12415 [Candidatus Binataceae bacterium]|jgi:hypothetical protein